MSKYIGGEIMTENNNSTNIKNINIEQPNTTADCYILEELLPENFYSDSSFHNPYTFWDFPEINARESITPYSIGDIKSPETFSGVLELKVTLESPLLIKAGYSNEECCKIRNNKKIYNNINEHKKYKALTIGDDVIVPASSVRGSLRYLMTLITDGPLLKIDNNEYLSQGRDINLGNDKKKLFLAQVIKKGAHNRDGEIMLGETKLIKFSLLNNFYKEENGVCLERPSIENNTVKYFVTFDNNNKLESIEKIDKYESSPHEKNTWVLKLSGEPIDNDGVDKEEALFKQYPDNKKNKIRINKKLWAQYQSRHRSNNCFRSSLKKGDLIWLEPQNSNITRINNDRQIKSLQWARLGRKGTHLKSLLKNQFKNSSRPSGSIHLYPDSERTDGRVHLTTNLFGQVTANNNRNNSNISFAARIRPDNLVFQDTKDMLNKQPLTLPVLSSPNPGCLAFYRKAVSPDTVSAEDPLRGYKVYRTSKHAGFSDDKAPWRYQNQGNYKDDEETLKPEQQKFNFSAQLLPEKNGENATTGTLNLSLRGVSSRELAILLACCSTKWRLGGGKPLGLGLCSVEPVALLDETGETVPDFTDTYDLSKHCGKIEADRIKGQIDHWEKTQLPVEDLKYPRAVEVNKNKTRKEGLSWFKNNANPKFPKNDPTECKGLKKTYVVKDESNNKAVAIPGQLLPDFDPAGNDTLFGYDVIYDTNHRRKITLCLPGEGDGINVDTFDSDGIKPPETENS